MPEQLLNRSKVCAAFDQMGGKRVAEAVWIGEEPPERRGLEGTTSGGEEQCVDRTAGEVGAAMLEVQTEAESCLLTQRDGALLASLASNQQGLLLEVDVSELEVDGLLRSQAG